MCGTKNRDKSGSGNIYGKQTYCIKDMKHAIENYFFACLPIAEGEKNTIEKIVSSMYKDNIQIRREKDLSIFHKVDLPLLWFS